MLQMMKSRILLIAEAGQDIGKKNSGFVERGERLLDRTEMYWTLYVKSVVAFEAGRRVRFQGQSFPIA